jgi:hypothetical protein
MLVLVTALVATVLAVQAPAGAAPRPYTATVVGQTPTGVSQRTAAATVAASAASPGCVLSTSYPSLYDSGTGKYVVSSGQIKCANPVGYIFVHVDAFHDGLLVGSSESSAPSRTGYKLYSLTHIYGPACQPGLWYFQASGYAYGTNGALAISGRVTSTTIQTNC